MDQIDARLRRLDPSLRFLLESVPASKYTKGDRSMPSFYEFFAGGGMARAGLGASWRCLLADDLDTKKAASYARNWGGEALYVADVASLTPAELPGQADLAWASFPCQDLSLAGVGAGVNGVRSGTFWTFCRLLQGLQDEGRAPRLIVLENVCGALTSHGGQDFVAIGRALSKTGYRFGALVINAMHFLPQSRPRLFIIGQRREQTLPAALIQEAPDVTWHPPALRTAYHQLPAAVAQDWVWWRLPKPPTRTTYLADLIEEAPHSVTWHSAIETKRLLPMMTVVNLAKVNAAKKQGSRVIGTIYKRTRMDAAGVRTQRAEVRFDGLAGCLRTPTGGSSRQTLIVVEAEMMRTRLLSAREAARLMGLPESYRLPDRYNDAYHLAGDGLAVPVVRHLAAALLEPLLAIGQATREAA